MSRRFYTLVVFVFGVIMNVQSAFAANNITPGEYAFRLREGVTGMPLGIAELQWQECLTASHPIPTAYLPASCNIITQHNAYHTIRYQLSCFGKHGTFINAGQIHFGRLQLTGKSKSDVGVVDGENMLIRYTFAGRRIGACPATLSQ